MALQAIIMAGGEGVRLRPMTVLTPKPLVPLLGKPVMGYAVDLLKKHGLNDIGVTLWYQPQKIKKAFGRGEGYGVRVRYHEEKAPLGTAGSVKMAQKHLKETFFVLSGDGLTDCDLKKALSFHKEKNALATLVLKRVSIPLPYGVVVTDRESRIIRFIEKPTWNRAYSNLVNTGIYILEPEILDYIPNTGAPDFGKDIFPALVSGGLPVYGCETEAYWCDVGDQTAYLEAQMDLLRGTVDLPHAAGEDRDAVIDPLSRIEGNCLIGKDSRIGPGALIRNSVIGQRCVIEPGAVIEDSCLWDEVHIGEKARITGSVLCDGAAARQGAQLENGCAIGQRASVGAHALLKPGVKVWPHLKVMPDIVASNNITSINGNLLQWTDKGVDCDSAETLCSLCAAFVKIMNAKKIMILYSGSSSLETIAGGAVSAAGAQAICGGRGTRGMLRSLIRALRLDGGIFFEAQTLCFFDRQGNALSSKVTNAVTACVLRQETPPFYPESALAVHFTGTDEVYLAAILPPEDQRALYASVAVFSDNPQIIKLSKEGFSGIGAKRTRFSGVSDAKLQPGETGFILSETGEEMTVFTQNAILSKEQTMLLILKLCKEKNGKLFDMQGVPRAAKEICALNVYDDSQACAWQKTMLTDSIAAMLLICSALKNEPLNALVSTLPETHISMREILCKKSDKGHILSRLTNQINYPYTLDNGIVFSHRSGYASIVPDRYLDVVRVSAEAANSEFAQEICDFYSQRIQEIVEQGKAEKTK